MGKGLGLSPESQGMHVVFAAGTGVLPFVDLVARLMMSIKGIVSGDQKLHPSFKLEFYASFQSREDAIAL